MDDGPAMPPARGLLSQRLKDSISVKPQVKQFSVTSSYREGAFQSLPVPPQSKANEPAGCRPEDSNAFF